MINRKIKHKTNKHKISNTKAKQHTTIKHKNDTKTQTPKN